MDQEWIMRTVPVILGVDHEKELNPFVRLYFFRSQGTGIGHRGQARCEVANKSCYEPCKNSCSKSEYSLSISVSSVGLRRDLRRPPLA